MSINYNFGTPNHSGGSNPAHVNLPTPRPRRYFVRNRYGKWVEVDKPTYDSYRRVYDEYDGPNCVGCLAIAVVDSQSF